MPLIPHFFLLFLWGFTAVHFHDLPKEIPIHFNAKGVPDSYATRIHSWGIPLIATFLFLLNIGDLIAVSKVAGDRMYGTVRIDLYDKRSFNYFQGWVLSKHTILVHNNISVKTLEQVDE